MADPFTPKFADLVRNTTTTVGTGSFVLGPPVNGFTGFMAALNPGDSFYYSAIGVDRPSEREIGRGTLQADGTISRQPISGQPTNFSTGTKTIALVAAAEWFQNVQLGGGTAGSAQASAATRDELSRLSPASQVAMLRESGREGLFVFDPSNRSADVSRDPAQGVFVAPASAPTGASGAWVRKYDGHLNVAWFGGAPGADLAPVMRNILAFIGDDAATAFIPQSNTPYLWNSKVDWVGALSLVGQPSTSMLSAVVDAFLHGALIKVPAGVTAIVPQRTAATYGDGVTFSGLSFRATGANSTSTTGAMTADTRTLTLAAAADFANGQVVRVRGAGPHGYLRGNAMRGTTVAGSPVITLAAQTDAALGVVAGQVLNLNGGALNSGGAFPSGTRVLSVVNDNGGGTYTITMSANATATVAAPTKIDVYGDLYGYIISGGGTTTLNLTSMAHRTVTGAIVEHYDCAIFGLTGYRVERCTTEAFQGAGFFLGAGARYVSPDGVTTTNANCAAWDGVNVRTGRNGIVIDGTDANASQFSNVYTVSTTEWGIIDQSLLGNLWNNSHTSGGYGTLHVIDSASQSQFNYAYTEGGTVNSFASGAVGNGYQSADGDGGIRFCPANGTLGVPAQHLVPLEKAATFGQWYVGLRRSELNTAGVLHAELSAIGGSTTVSIFDTFRTGIIGITDHQANKTLLGFTMANHALGAGHSLVNSLYLGDGSEGANAVTASKYRSLRTGSAAPTTGTWVQGDVVLNNAPTAGSTLYWRCVAGGAPGTWEAVSAGGGGGVSDGDKGDVVVSGSGATWKVESAQPADGSFNVTGDVDASGTVVAGGSVYAGAGVSVGGALNLFSDGTFGTLRGSISGIAGGFRFAAGGSNVMDVTTSGVTVGVGDVVIGDSARALYIGSSRVVAARKTGWALDTGTAKRTANATYSGTAEASYTQATIQALMDAVRDLSQTVKALKDDLHSTAGHGLIGA